MYDGSPRKIDLVSSSYCGGFEYSVEHGGDGLFEVEHLFDAGHVIS